MNIIDNFLPEEQFRVVQSVMMGDNFPWYWIPNITYPDSQNERNGQFTHAFFIENKGKQSDMYPLLNPIIAKLYGSSSGVIYRVKANLNPREDKHYQLGAYHVDYPIQCKTAIYYINTNNGHTKFIHDDIIVPSVENRMVIFNSNLEHVGVCCTDEKTRVLINFNYITYQ